MKVLLVFISAYAVMCALLIVGLNETLGGGVVAILCIGLAVGLALVFVWLGSRRERKNRKYLFDIQLGSCRLMIQTLEGGKDGADPRIIRIRMEALSEQFGRALRVGYSTRRQKEAYSEAKYRFFVLQKEHGMWYDDEL